MAKVVLVVVVLSAVLPSVFDFEISSDNGGRRRRQSPVPTLNPPIPTSVAHYLGTDQLLDACKRNEVQMVTGGCHQLLTQGPCKPTEFVLLDPESGRGHCRPRLCSPDRIFVFSDQLCHDPRGTTLCPPGRQMYSSAFGTPVCQCPDGTYEGDDDLDDDVCDPILGQTLSCQPGQVLWFKDFGLPPECLPDPCGGDNLNRGPNDLPFVPAADGRCYQLGQMGGVCPAPTWYSLAYERLQGVCATLEETGYQVFDPDTLALINQIYGPPIPRETTAPIPVTESPGALRTEGVAPGVSDPTGVSPGVPSPTGVSPGVSGPTGVSPGFPSPTGVSPGVLDPTGVSPGASSPIGVSPGVSVPSGVSPGVISPGVSVATGASPAVSDFTGVGPGVSDLTGVSPGVSDLTGVSPGISGSTGVIPAVLSSGVSDPTGVSSGTSGLTGVSPGVSSVTGVSPGVSGVAGVSPGVSGVTGVSSGVSGVTGVNPGLSGVTGVGHGVSGVTGVSPGVSGVTGVSPGLSGVTGVSHGISGVTGVSPGVSGATGVSPGVSGVTGVSPGIYGSADVRPAIPGPTIVEAVPLSHKVVGPGDSGSTTDGALVSGATGVSPGISGAAGVSTGVSDTAGVSTGVSGAAGVSTGVSGAAGVSTGVSGAAGVGPGVSSAAGVGPGVSGPTVVKAVPSDHKVVGSGITSSSSVVPGLSGSTSLGSGTSIAAGGQMVYGSSVGPQIVPGDQGLSHPSTITSSQSLSHPSTITSSQSLSHPSAITSGLGLSHPSTIISGQGPSHLSTVSTGQDLSRPSTISSIQSLSRPPSISSSVQGQFNIANGHGPSSLVGGQSSVNQFIQGPSLSNASVGHRPGYSMRPQTPFMSYGAGTTSSPAFGSQSAGSPHMYDDRRHSIQELNRPSTTDLSLGDSVEKPHGQAATNILKGQLVAGRTGIMESGSRESLSLDFLHTPMSHKLHGFLKGVKTIMGDLLSGRSHHRSRRAPLPHATPGNVFETRLVGCRAGAQRDINAKCRDTILPSHPPASRATRAAPPVPPQPGCPNGQAYDLQRTCTSSSNAVNSINAFNLG
ncbi:spidroin-2-like [Cherax quadricarinatus]